MRRPTWPHRASPVPLRFTGGNRSVCIVRVVFKGGMLLRPAAWLPSHCCLPSIVARTPSSCGEGMRDGSIGMATAHLDPSICCVQREVLYRACAGPFRSYLCTLGAGCLFQRI